MDEIHNEEELCQAFVKLKRLKAAGGKWDAARNGAMERSNYMLEVYCFF